MKLLFLLFFLLFLAQQIFAHCPLCTAATGVVVTTTRFFGVDDVIVGTFIAAFLVSTGFWFDREIKKRLRHSIPFQPYLLSLIFLITTVISFYPLGLLGTTPYYLFLFGMERLLFGIVLGTVVCLLAFWMHGFMREWNGNKNYIPFQGIVLLFGMLLIANAGLYLFGLI